MSSAGSSTPGKFHNQPDLLDPEDIASFRNDPRIPELANLSIKQRQYVWKHCAQPYLSRRRIILHGFVCLLIAATVAFSLQLAFDVEENVFGWIIFLAVAFHNHIWITHSRRRIRSFIQNNTTALEAAEKASWLHLPTKPASKMAAAHHS